MKARTFLILTLLLSSVAMVGPLSPQPAAADECPLRVLNGDGTFRNAYCTSYPDSDSGGDDGGGGGGRVCRVVWGYEDVEDDEVLRALWWRPDEVPDEVTWWWNRCSFDEPHFIQSGVPVPVSEAPLVCVDCDPEYGFTERVEVEPGLSWEEHLLRGLWAEVEGQLAGPEPVYEPPLGRPAIVHIPTFVSLDDPPTVVEPAEVCSTATPPGIPQVCVGVRAEPSLWYAPGDGTEAFACDPASPSYDPDLGPPSAQEDGACTHTYEQHTSVSYEADVFIVWHVSWWAEGGEAGRIDGVFDDLELYADPRPSRMVDEVQAIVTDVGRDGDG